MQNGAGEFDPDTCKKNMHNSSYTPEEVLRLRRDLEVGRLEVRKVGHDQVGAEGREPLLQRGRPLAEEAIDL